MTAFVRNLLYLSVAIGGFCTLVFFGALAGEEGDISGLAFSTLTTIAFGWGLNNMARERKLDSTPLAKIYLGIWLYWATVAIGFTIFVATAGRNPFAA